MTINFKSEGYGRFFNVDDGELTNFSSLTDTDYGMSFSHSVSVNSAPPVSSTGIYTLSYKKLQSLSRIGYVNVTYTGTGSLHTGGYYSGSSNTFTIDLDDGTNNLELLRHSGGISQSGSNTSTPSYTIRGCGFITIDLSDLTILTGQGAYYNDVSGVSISGGSISNSASLISNNTSYSAFDLDNTNLIITSYINASSSSSASTSSTTGAGIFSVFGGKK